MVTWLTSEANERLRAELAHLTGPGRADVVAKIEAARDEGDLKENGGYHAAKEEQGKQEARVRQLTAFLRDVVTGPPPNADDLIDQGSIVTADYGDGDVERFLFASRENAGEGGKITVGTEVLDVYSPESPIGQAVLGHRAGDVVAFGPRNLKVTIVAVEPYSA
ncbi:MAG TPA: transcription elongation factor GreA [Mycobacteriales bacterium]|nr:transcription elongation factor GreA [Mycobacteriales bacterium]